MKHRWIAIALALLAAIAFSMSVQGGRWWTIGDAEIGPFGAKRCFDDECVPAGLAWLGAGERWMRIGIATWAAGLIATFLLVLMSARMAAKRVPRLAAKTTLVAIGTAAIAGGVFIVQFPSEFPATISRGIVLFAVAIVLGGTAAIVVLKTKR